MRTLYFPQEVFQARRQRFLKELGNSMAVLFAAPQPKRSADNHYEFRTCSYFYYLTGYVDEEAVAIFQPNAKEPYRLFVLPRDPARELWDGKRYGVDGAKKAFAVDGCFDVAEFEKAFKDSLREVDTLYYALGEYAEHDELVLGIVRKHTPKIRTGDKPFVAVKKVQTLLDPMRRVKDEAELNLMRKNCRNSALAYRATMAATKPGITEYQVAAEIAYQFQSGGAEFNAYGSIVAGGNNACILHYKTNRDKIPDNALVLIDAGGEMGLYASDITRTYPVSGKFSPGQKRIYEIVLNAQKAAIAKCKPGVPYVDIHKRACEVLVEGLMGLGLLKGTKDEHLKPSKEFTSFYPHSTGHWIGIDVHDVGEYHDADKKSLPLQVGNVLTVEPGIYIDESRTDVPAEYRGIGIRIEDDVLVTNGDPEVLTIDAPKEIADIEAIVGSKQR